MTEGLTRFANSTIHQNVVKNETENTILYVIDKKIGIISAIGKKAELSIAKEVALNSKKNPDFVSLPDVDEAGEQKFKGSFSKNTAETKPGIRAELVKEAFRLCEKSGLKAAGLLSTGFIEKNIENSLGIKRHDRTSFAEFTITAIGAGTGYTTAKSYNLDQIDIKKLTNEAIETAIKNSNPIKIEPGKYQVLLEPLATHELFEFLCWIALGGLLYDENRSCFSGKLNQEVTSPLLTFFDEPVSDLPSLGIDIEGVARRKTILVEKGMLKNVVYDSYSAHKVSKKSTGNAFSLVSPFGGFPLSINIVPGDSNPENMLSEIKNGLLIKRFWYTRVVNRREGILTGMTRDGTFLVVDGQIERPVKNLRFQILLPEILKQVKMVGNSLRLYEYGRIPHLLIDDFNVTGMTG
jgi:predicted Zn-dependent protease